MVNCVNSFSVGSPYEAAFEDRLSDLMPTPWTRGVLAVIDSLGELSDGSREIPPSKISAPLSFSVSRLEHLESEFSASCIHPVDVKAEVNFTDYLEPNEGGVIEARSHLRMNQPGLLVSVGTERSFFDLILCAQVSGNLCQGLVVRDINPRVKAYVDLVTLLLRIAEDYQDFVKLSVLNSDQDKIEDRIAEIRAKLELSQIPPDVKIYYQKHLEDFCFLYFGLKHEWRGFDGFLNYYKSEGFFKILQSYAKRGDIIATIGDVGDLQFLGKRRVEIVDISNIPDYVLINLRGYSPECKLRVIWTEQSFFKTDYHSFIYRSLSNEEKKEFDELLQRLRDAQVLRDGCREGSLLSRLLRSGEKNLKAPCYSTEMLGSLRMYNRTHLKYFPVLGWVVSNPLDIDRFIRKINSCTPEQLKILSQLPEFQSLVVVLVQSWAILKPDIYFLLFQEVSGWKEAFFAEASAQSGNVLFREHFEAFPLYRNYLKSLR